MILHRALKSGYQVPCGCALALIAGLLALPVAAIAQVKADDTEPMPATVQEQQEAEIKQLGTPQAPTLIDREAYRELFKTGRYLVGPGDGFMVMIGSEAPIFREVMVEGGLLIPGLGHVRVGGESLAAARRIITEAYHGKFKEGTIAVELSQLRQFPVSVVGAVEGPGLYVTTGVVRVGELVRQARLAGASRRNIRLVKTDALDATGRAAVNRFVAGGAIEGIEELSSRVDMGLFEATGDGKYNPFVEWGDLILVPRQGGQLRISGSIQRPGTFEFVPGDRASDLLTLGLGTTPEHDREQIFLYRYLKSMLFLESLDLEMDAVLAGSDGDLLLQNGDWLVVRALEEYLEPSAVSISGQVAYPGHYVVERDKTRLRDIVEAAGGFTDKASIEASRLYRVSSDEELRDPEFERIRNVPVGDRSEDENQYFMMKSREIVGQMVVDFVHLFVEGDESENVLLMPGDLIVIPEQPETVKVSGQAAFPGAVVHNTAYGVDDYITQAGGFGWRASKDIRVIRARTGEMKRARDVAQLDPGDRVWIKEKPRRDYWEIFTQAMTVVGNMAALMVVVLAI